MKKEIQKAQEKTQPPPEMAEMASARKEVQDYRSPARADARIEIVKINSSDFSLPEPDSDESNLIKKTIDFPQKWLRNPIFKYPPFRDAVRECLKNPEHSQILLNWNRALVKNYNKNKFYLFYPEERKNEFIDPYFIAGYRNLIRDSLPVFNRVMIHGAALMIRDKAAVFLAPDEGGKSTLIKSALGKKIFSDDNIILEMRKNSAHIHSTPFGELTSGNIMSELGAFFLIKKTKKFGIETAKPSTVLKFIWDDQFDKWYHFPKSLRIKLFDMIYDSAKKVPCFNLNAPKNFSAWDEIEKIF